MMTLLIVVGILGQSFDIASYDVVIDTQVIENALYYICRKEAIAEISSSVELEPVHDSTKWPSYECAQVECTACDDSTQDGPYFK